MAVYQNPNRRKKNSSWPRSPRTVAASLVALVLALTGIGWATHRADNQPSQQPPSPSLHKQPPAPKTNPGKPSKGSSRPTKSTPPPAPTAYLKAPTDSTFVSSHRAKLTSAEESICLTTPGAECYIQFAQNGVVKSLPVGTANKDGAVVWDWVPKKVGLTSGSWQVTAVAKLGSQTKSASDAIKLQLQ